MSHIGIINAQMQVMDYLFGSMLAALAVTVLLCRRNLTHHKPISWITLATSTIIGNLLAFIVILFCQEGWHVFSAQAWSRSIGEWLLLGMLFGFIAAFSALPALAVTVYYHRLAERAESPAV